MFKRYKKLILRQQTRGLHRGPWIKLHQFDINGILVSFELFYELNMSFGKVLNVAP